MFQKRKFSGNVSRLIDPTLIDWGWGESESVYSHSISCFAKFASSLTDLSVECAFEIYEFAVTKISEISLAINIKIHIVLVLALSHSLDPVLKSLKR